MCIYSPLSNTCPVYPPDVLAARKQQKSRRSCTILYIGQRQEAKTFESEIYAVSVFLFWRLHLLFIARVDTSRLSSAPWWLWWNFISGLVALRMLLSSVCIYFEPTMAWTCKSIVWRSECGYLGPGFSGDGGGGPPFPSFTSSLCASSLSRSRVLIHDNTHTHTCNHTYIRLAFSHTC